MFYFDHAATTLIKPKEVIEAVTEAMCTVGNSGRSAHDAALDASRIVYEAREALAHLFHAENPSCIVFAANGTESLNIAIKGLLEAGDHVITTALEHNSVLRPLYEMEQKGVELTILEADLLGNICYEQLKASIRDNTKAIVCTHASNLTGNVLDLERIGAMAEEHGLLFVVDASQTAGLLPVDVEKMHIDVLCFTGHKALYGPQGTGGMYVRSGVSVRPLLSGGTGFDTYNKSQPEQMPARLEAGTLNVHGIAGLSAGVRYIEQAGMESLLDQSLDLMREFYEKIRTLSGITIYGDFSTSIRCPILSLNVEGVDSARVSDLLAEEYGIATRAGGHCAPLMHQALHTQEQGAVRFSFSHFNTKEDVAQAIMALCDIAADPEDEEEQEIWMND